MHHRYASTAPACRIPPQGSCHVCSLIEVESVPCVLQVYAASRRNVRTDELHASELVATSAFSKMVASTITYPHEVIRSYMHVTGQQGRVRGGLVRVSGLGFKC
jgi:hypothetical protein